MPRLAIADENPEAIPGNIDLVATGAVFPIVFVANGVIDDKYFRQLASCIYNLFY